jgi:hypothetical protein
MQWANESKDKLNDKHENIEIFRRELAILRISIYNEEIRLKRKKRIRKFIRKKIVERKRKEAFPRKAGKYNELFQDFGKESWVHSHPDQ